jgi:hypothetical protein
MNKPREYDRNGKRIVPLTKAVRAQRRRQFSQVINLYKTLHKPL